MESCLKDLVERSPKIQIVLRETHSFSLKILMIVEIMTNRHLTHLREVIVIAAIIFMKNQTNPQTRMKMMNLKMQLKNQKTKLVQQRKKQA